MRPTICLNMIVRNEAHVILRCLDSLLSLIDYWVIVDTGSTDGTQQLIRKHLQDIPGELHERPWVDFGHNRNEAMDLAKSKGDYLLLIDADDLLSFSDQFVLPSLDADLYSIIQREGEKSTFREHSIYFLIRNNCDFRWNGVLHEFLSSPTPKTRASLEGVVCLYKGDGQRSKDPEKIEKDIALLKEAVHASPSESRNYFYLARTYWSIRRYALALQWFEKRARLGGDPIEVYHSLLYVALSQKSLNYPEKNFLNSFALAHRFRPSRIEALYEMARYYNQSNRYLEAYALLKVAEKTPPSSDNLFVESWVWVWGVSLQLFISAFSLQWRQEALDEVRKLVCNRELPQSVRKEYQLDAWKEQLEWEPVFV